MDFSRQSHLRTTIKTRSIEVTLPTSALVLENLPVGQEEFCPANRMVLYRDLSVALASGPLGIYNSGLLPNSMEPVVKSRTVQRREVYYSGNVQGVGFRYTTRHLASRYEVTGFVRNLPDRRVQVVVEGSLSDIKALLKDIARTMEGHVRNTEVFEVAATGEFEGFDIRF
jgi:acylphosphatase